jgi:hypothetical protein
VVIVRLRSRSLDYPSTLRISGGICTGATGRKAKVKVTYEDGCLNGVEEINGADNNAPIF